MRIQDSPLYCVMDDRPESHPGKPGKAGQEDEIKSGDLLYIEDSFRWGKGSVYAAFSLPFFKEKHQEERNGHTDRHRLSGSR